MQINSSATKRLTVFHNTLQKDPSNSEKEAVLYIYRQLRNADPADDASAREVINNLFFSEKRYDLGDGLKKQFMEMKEFVSNFAAQFDETEESVFTPETRFREIEEWSCQIN